MQDLDLNFHSIARDLYSALSPIAFTPANYNEVIDRLARLVENATTLRFGETYQLVEAEQIGATLADLNYIQGDAIGLFLKILSNAWMNNSSIAINKSDQERISNLFSDIVNGYFKATTKYILKSQEMIREAQLSTVRALHADLRKQKDHLSLTAERLQAVHDIESGILTAKSAETIADVAITRIMRIIPCSFVFIANINFRNDTFNILASKNLSRTTGDNFPLDVTTEERLQLLKNSRNLIINDLGALENRPPGLEKMYSQDIKSVMTIPLLTPGRLVGILTLGSKIIDSYTEHHVEIVRQIADSVAIALHNRELLETEQRARRESEILREVAASISSNLDQEKLLDNILFHLENLLLFDGAIILLINGNKSQVVAQRGFQKKYISNFNDLDQLPPNMQRVLNNKEPLYIPDIKLDPKWIKLPGAHNVRCWLGAPLIFKEEIIGLLALDKNEPDFYLPSAIGLALTFANHAAFAIKNAQLFKEVQQNTEMLRERVATRTRELESLYEIAAISSQPIELPSILNTGLERILRDLACHAGAIHVLDNDSRTFNLVEFVNLYPSNLDRFQSIDPRNPFLRELIDKRQPIVLKTTVDEQPVNWLLPLNDDVCLIAVPMRARGDIHGIMTLYCGQDHELTADEIKLAASIADHLGVAIDNAHLQAQSEHAAVIEERERLARDLHDSATQSLFSLNLFAAAAREKVVSGQLDVAISHLDDISYTANQTHREMRLLLYQLGTTSQKIGETLVEALERRLHAVEERSGINVKFLPLQTTDLNSDVARALYQIANEALNNALKHAGGTNVKVEFLEDISHIILSIKDNGNGFNLANAQKGAGMGLRNMRFRAYGLGGDLSIISVLGEGTEIRARIPKDGIPQSIY